MSLHYILIENLWDIYEKTCENMGEGGESICNDWVICIPYCILQPAVVCWALQTLVKICSFHIFFHGFDAKMTKNDAKMTVFLPNFQTLV